MSNFGMVLAQAGDTGNGEALLGWIIIVGFLWAICKACNKKKTYDVRMGGTVRER